MSIIAAKSDYIYRANIIYQKLSDFEEQFEVEANIISYLKCALLRNSELEDFSIAGTYVSVYQKNDGYSIYYDDYLMEITVYDKQIINFSISRN